MTDITKYASELARRKWSNKAEAEKKEIMAKVRSHWKKKGGLKENKKYGEEEKHTI